MKKVKTKKKYKVCNKPKKNAGDVIISKKKRGEGRFNDRFSNQKPFI